MPILLNRTLMRELYEELAIPEIAIGAITVKNGYPQRGSFWHSKDNPPYIIIWVSPIDNDDSITECLLHELRHFYQYHHKRTKFLRDHSLCKRRGVIYYSFFSWIERDARKFANRNRRKYAGLLRRG